MSDKTDTSKNHDEPLLNQHEDIQYENGSSSLVIDKSTEIIELHRKSKEHALLLKKIHKTSKDLNNHEYLKELKRLQIELVKLQEYIRYKGLKVVVIFEGRDAAGKGGVIKRITQRLNPRVCRVVALNVPTEKEKTQWYFQRCISQLPAAGEMVLFDRSWYNRAGVEHVMGFCTNSEYHEFMRSCPEFERMLIRSGIILIKYWFSISSTEQEQRFQARLTNPVKRWKLSPMDLKSRQMWDEYTMAKINMFAHTDIQEAPWYVVKADDKKKARLNCIASLLKLIPYQDITPEVRPLPKRKKPTVENPIPKYEPSIISEIY